MGAPLNLIGEKYGMLTVVSQTDKRDSLGSIIWGCVCECGTQTEASTRDLRSGHKQTCGKHVRKYGFIRKDTRLYRTWVNMKNRCYWGKDKSFGNYGGRGICVCDEWKNDYASFRKWALDSGYRENLTIDRIDPNGNYEPSNCRWATIREQENNKRNNVLITFDKKTLTATEWARILGIKPITLLHRVHAGWTTEKALLTPVRPKTEARND